MTPTPDPLYSEDARGIDPATLRAGMTRNPARAAPADVDPGPESSKPERMLDASEAPAFLPGAEDVVQALAVQERLSTGVWWRKLLRLGPSEREIRVATNEAIARRVISPRCVTIMVAQPKGGAGKTPTAAGLAGAFGTARSGFTLALDANETRGGLCDGLRNSTSATIWDMIRDLPTLRERGAVDLGTLQRYCAFQTAGKFWSLASGRVAGRQLGGQEFYAVWQLLSAQMSYIVVDTGNNESASNWDSAMWVSDVLVVPCKWKRNSLTAAAEMLRLVSERKPQLLDRTIIVGTNGPGEAEPDAQATAQQMWGNRFPIVEIPVDAALWSGSSTDWDVLQEATREAYMHLAAQITTVYAGQMAGSTTG